MNLCCPRCLKCQSPAAITPEARCAECGSALLPDEPIELNDSSFAQFLTRSEVPVLVDAGAQWCGPCRGMAPHFADAAEALAGQMVLASIDVDAAPQTATRLHIQSVPTLLLFAGGRERARESGARGADEIRRWALAHLALAPRS